MSLPRHLPPAQPPPELLALCEPPGRIPAAVRRQADFFVFFAREIFPLLESYRARLAPLYCPDNGRPAWDPIRLLGVLILQYVLRQADRLAAEAVQYQDMLALWREAGDYWPIAARDAFVLLQRVFLENYQFEGIGGVQATRAQPTGAGHNPHEPEAQWSSKSTTKDKSRVGYKVQVAETVQRAQPRERGEPTANFLTAILTQDAPASDKPGLAQVKYQKRMMEYVKLTCVKPPAISLGKTR